MTDRTHPDSGHTTGGIVEMLHARIAELEAQLASIGAGGVSGPLIGQPQAMPDLSALTERGAKAWAGVDAQALREDRWYMVNKDGMPTLCADKKDAEREAAFSDKAWPSMAPHRAVQLVEAGRASLAANAGEPVAWMTFTEEGDPDMVFLDRLEACQYCEDDDPPKPLYLAAPPTAQAGGWKDGIEAVAKMLEKKADDFAQQHGYEDMGSLSFGRGPHADAKLDHHSLLCELAEEVRGLTPPTSAEGVEHG